MVAEAAVDTPRPARQGVGYIGCAGWSLPREQMPAFASEGSHLQRYATRLSATEINSSFHRPHSAATYGRWAASVPEAFRFSVKLPRTLTHERLLVDCDAALGAFMQQVSGLGNRLGCLLVQLPPRLAYDPAVATAFFSALRRRHAGRVVAEPRHASWFEPAADALLADLQVARVLADPVRHAAGRFPGGWPQLVYLRLHGSPRMYYSAYAPELISALAQRIRTAQGEGIEVWCVFDNTAGQAATANALELAAALRQ